MNAAAVLVFAAATTANTQAMSSQAGPSTAATTTVAARTHARTVASSTTSTSWEYIGALFVHCSYDVVVGQAVSLSAIKVRVDGRSAYEPDTTGGGCSLMAEGALAGSTATETGRAAYEITGIAGDLAAGARLLRCTGIDLIEGSDGPISIDFTDVEAWSTYATDASEQQTDPPDLCIADISCDGEPYEFQWSGVPMCGDADYDFVVRSVDALRALRVSVGLHGCTPLRSSCDTDADGSVTATDALRILGAAISLPVSLTCPIPCNP